MIEYKGEIDNEYGKFHYYEGEGMTYLFKDYKFPTTKQLLFFSKGETCEPCKEVQQYLDYKGVRGYFKLNPFEEIDLSIQHNISTVPCLILLEDGKEIKRVVGAKVMVNSKRFDKLIELYNS